MKNIFSDLEIALSFVVIVTITVAVAWLFNYIFSRYIKRNINKIKADPTNYQFIRHFITGIIYMIGVGWAFLTLPNMKTVAHTFLAGAGVMTLIVGLASQQTLSNIISGLFLVIFKPFRVNDRVKLRDIYMGIIEDITLRHTIIRDIENNRIVVPNSVISGEILVNLHLGDSRVCRIIEIPISYSSNIELAKQIIREEVEKHPLCIDARSHEEIELGIEGLQVRVISLGNSAINLRVLAWAENAAKGFILYSDLLQNIKQSFDAQGVEIPYNYQNVILKKEKE